MLQYSTHFLFISLIIRNIFHFILSDQLEKVFSVHGVWADTSMAMSKVA